MPRHPRKSIFLLRGPEWLIQVAKKKAYQELRSGQQSSMQKIVQRLLIRGLATEISLGEPWKEFIRELPNGDQVLVALSERMQQDKALMMRKAGNLP